MKIEYRVSTIKAFDAICSIAPAKIQNSGFAILAEIKTSEILNNKGFSCPPLRTYAICNAAYASKALLLDKRVEVILPCHLIVKDAGDRREVSVQLPGDIFQALGILSEKGNEFINEIEEKLKRLVDSIVV